MSDSSQYAGLTVNERLLKSGLGDKWDIAVRARARAAMIEILEALDMAAEAVTTTDAVLANPRFYGF
jgi:hypothetical protein